MKHYVDMLVRVDVNGRMRPLRFLWDNGKEYKIERVLSVCKAASLKEGREGLRYTCQICNKVRFLYYEGDRWFVECDG
ncbi:MAG: hypothetical protein E7191_05060 [Erysipelotrichaceae bacterium]|nr:hypothetical protein [Erysipelotrichaceae bacterium]MBR3693082.1 hypothetical protein [Erysipelotrichales bacterium]